MIEPMSSDLNNTPNLEVLQTLKAHLDSLIEKASYWPTAPSADVQAVFEEAIKNFKERGVQLLIEATPYIWMFYQDIVKNYSEEILKDYNIPKDVAQDDIWKYVVAPHSPTIGIGGKHKFEPGRSYIVFDADFVWEEEHALQLVFEDGLNICRVSHYDGWYTNARSRGDESLIGVVYRQ